MFCKQILITAVLISMTNTRVFSFGILFRFARPIQKNDYSAQQQQHDEAGNPAISSSHDDQVPEGHHLNLVTPHHVSYESHKPSYTCLQDCKENYANKAVLEQSCQTGCKLLLAVLDLNQKNGAEKSIIDERHTCESGCEKAYEDMKDRQLACQEGCEHEDVTRDMKKEGEAAHQGGEQEEKSVFSGVLDKVTTILGFKTDLYKRQKVYWIKDGKGLHVMTGPSHLLIVKHPPRDYFNELTGEPTKQSRIDGPPAVDATSGHPFLWTSLCHFPEHARWVLALIMVLIALTLLYMAYFVCISASKLTLKKEEAKDNLLKSLSIIPTQYEKLKEEMGEKHYEAPPLLMKVKLEEA